MIQAELVDKLTPEQLKFHDYLKKNDRCVYLYEQDGNICAEVENWTEGGVDMIIMLNPFSIEEMQNFYDNFDVDEEICVHREDERYRNNFTIRQSVNDFEEWLNELGDLICGYCQTEKVPATDLAEQRPSDSKALEMLKEWSESSSNFLCDKNDYSRGYKNGICRAKQIVRSIIQTGYNIGEI